MINKEIKKIENLILYVEDELDIREAVLEMLSRRIKNIIVAQNGSEGLELYIKEKPDIVITDIRMPIMNGLDMAKKIKEINKNCQIIVTSAHSDITYFTEAIEIGINQYVIKPINREKLFESIDKCATTLNYEKKLNQQNEQIAAQRDYLIKLNQELLQQKEEITLQKELLDNANKELTDKNQKLIESERKLQELNNIFLHYIKNSEK